mgnify:CR=1 FL=1
MNIYNYNFYNLFKESVTYSNEFENVLINMASKGNSLARYLLTVKDISRESKYDIVDINDNSNLISFKSVGKERFSDIKAGKIIQKLCDEYEIKASPREVEDFVNKYKAEIKLNTGKDDFKSIKGIDIKKYYNENNYYREIGTLGNSCMRYDKCAKFFDIYTDNSDKVSLLVLFKDNMVAGRSLIWLLDNGEYFMDRIYCNEDSDIEVFKSYAILNKYFYKDTQSSNINVMITNSKRNLELKDMKVTLINFEYKYYPYMDTFLYMTEGGLLHMDNTIKSKYLLRDDEGGSFNCHDCNNDGTILCTDCLGAGCDECDYIGTILCTTCENIK